MAINKSHPMRFTPKGLCDAFDSTDAFRGACRSLQNLVFDQANPEYVVARPGASQLSNLGALGFAGAAFISIQVTIGTRIYGLVATSRFAGHDEPFCIETAGNVAVPISGVTAASTPLSPSTSSDWTPPTVSNIGIYLIFTHPGFDGVTHFFGALNLSTMAWTAPNLVTQPLTSRPVAVANFNNRAYFAFGGNQLAYTDVLNPLVRTNANQQLTIGDTNIITALSGLPLQTTSSGVLQALTVFKPSQIWQVTGDTLTLDLALNYLSLNVGTTMPRSIALSPIGLYFGSNGGPYFIDPLGTLRQLTHDVQQPNPDVTVPFQNAVTPSRWAGAYSAGIYRVCGPTVLDGALSVNDYWFDERRRRWNGPHTFAYSCGSVLAGNFVLSSENQPGLLMSSPPLPNTSGISYIDVFTSYVCVMVSATFPKTGDMLQKQVAESQIELGDSTGYTIMALDEAGDPLDSVTITTPGPIAALWGGGSLWGGGGLWATSQPGAAKTYAVPWHAPLVFEKMALSVSAVAATSVQVGTFMARYQETGYMTINQGV